MVRLSTSVVVGLVAVLLVVVIAAVYAWRRGGLKGGRRERFATASAAAPTTATVANLAAKLKTFTQSERELFKNLQDNTYTTNQIDDLIKEGVLNSKVVDKFLAALNVV